MKCAAGGGGDGGRIGRERVVCFFEIVGEPTQTPTPLVPDLLVLQFLYGQNGQYAIDTMTNNLIESRLLCTVMCPQNGYGSRELCSQCSMTKQMEDASND